MPRVFLQEVSVQWCRNLLAVQLHQSDALIVPRPAGIPLSLPNEPDFLCESCAWHAPPWTLAKQPVLHVRCLRCTPQWNAFRYELSLVMVQPPGMPTRSCFSWTAARSASRWVHVLRCHVCRSAAFAEAFVSLLVLMDTHMLVQGSVTNMHVVDW